MTRHRAPHWWVRDPVATAAVAGALLVAAVVGVAALVAPTPDTARAQPYTAQTVRPPPAVTPWPTVPIPSIGAPGAWDPNSPTSPVPTAAGPPVPDRPTAPRCSRCGEHPAPTSASSPGSQTAAPEDTDTAAAQPAAAALLELVNADRTTAGCGPVTLSPALVGQSQAQADRQAAADTMSHSDGVTGYDTWAENVAAGYDTATAVHQAWMASPPHRANILNCGYTLIGYGAADSATGVRYWTEQFAA